MLETPIPAVQIVVQMDGLFTVLQCHGGNKQQTDIKMLKLMSGCLATGCWEWRPLDI